MNAADQQVTLSSLIARIRPEVRDRHAYVVGSYPGITVKLNQNESPFDLPRDLKSKILEELAEIPFNRYPEEQPTALCRAVASSLGVGSDQVLVGNGSNELTHTLGLCLAGPGQSVVLPRPMFALFETVARTFGARLTEVAPRSDLSFDTEGLIAAARETDASLTVVATPNNPTGLEMPSAEVRRIVESAPGFVLIDEAYTEFSSEPSGITLLRDHPNVIVMRTLSKGFGLAGLRIGFLLADARVISEFLKARLPFMVDRLAEITAIKLLQRPELIQDRVREMRQSVLEISAALTDMGIEKIPSRTNFILFRSPREPKELIRALTRHGVLIRDMSGYPELRHFVRVCAGTQAENKAFLDALKTELDA